MCILNAELVTSWKVYSADFSVNNHFSPTQDEMKQSTTTTTKEYGYTEHEATTETVEVKILCNFEISTDKVILRKDQTLYFTISLTKTAAIIDVDVPSGTNIKKRNKM